MRTLKNLRGFDSYFLLVPSIRTQLGAYSYHHPAKIVKMKICIPKFAFHWTCCSIVSGRKTRSGRGFRPDRISWGENA